MATTKATIRDLARQIQNKSARARIKILLDAIVDKVDAIVEEEAGFLTADVDGRAVIADDYFDAATVARVVDAKAITAASIADATITVTQLANNAVETAKIKDANVTQAKIAPAALDATVVKVAAAGNTLGAIPVYHAIAVADGSTVLDALTLNATYGKLTITDAWFQKNTTTGGETDAVQLCTDSEGTTAVTASMALNTVASGGIVRAATITAANAVFDAGAHLYVKRTHTTDCGGTLHIIGYRTA